MSHKTRKIVWHCSATKEGHEMTLDDLTIMHKAPLDLPSGRVRYNGRTFPSRQALKKALPDEKIGKKHVAELHGHGWRQYGYAVMVHLDGSATQLVPNNWDEYTDPFEITNGARGYNHEAIHFMYVGGLDKDGKGKDTRTEAQKKTMVKMTKNAKAFAPFAEVIGHRDLSPDKNGDGVIESNEWMKLCPCFDVRSWWGEVS